MSQLHADYTLADNSQLSLRSQLAEAVLLLLQFES